MPCQRRAVHKQRLIANLVVVADVRISEKKVQVANAREAPALLCPAADRDVLTKNIAVAHKQLSPLTAIAIILRITADRRKRIEHIVAAVLRWPADGGVWVKQATLAELHLVGHNRISPHLYSGSQLRAGRHDCLRMNFRPAHFAGSSALVPNSRSTILHMSVASAANCPFTVALPSSLQKSPRQEITLTSSRNWSPGTTGRRNRAPSTATKYSSLLSRSGISSSNSNPPVCAIASMINTPGMMGLPGKCP